MYWIEIWDELGIKLDIEMTIELPIELTRHVIFRNDLSYEILNQYRQFKTGNQYEHKSGKTIRERVI